MGEFNHKTDQCDGLNTYKVAIRNSFWRFDFDHEKITSQWSDGPLMHRHSVSLHRINPDFAEETVTDEKRAGTARAGIYLIIAAVVVYFSEYNIKLPLAVPALALIGVITFWRGFRGIIPHAYVRLRNDYDEVLMNIPYPLGEDVEQKKIRSTFQQRLQEAICLARQGQLVTDE